MWGVSAAVKKNERANCLCQQKSERNNVGVFTHTKPVGIMGTVLYAGAFAALAVRIQGSGKQEIPR